MVQGIKTEKPEEPYWRAELLAPFGNNQEEVLSKRALAIFRIFSSVEFELCVQMSQFVILLPSRSLLPLIQLQVLSIYRGTRKREERVRDQKLTLCEKRTLST